MSYDLYIGDRLFSSWSLRAWLMLEKFALPFQTHLLGLYIGTLQEDLKPLAPARFVPTLKTPDGIVVSESLAIAETLAEAHPDKNLWPADKAARAAARWMCAEMASGFTALRGECGMQLHHVKLGFEASEAVQRDLDRIQLLWAFARRHATEGPWLFGTYSIADAFFAPVCARMVGYSLPVNEHAEQYCILTLSDPAFKAWRAEALKTEYEPFPYEFGHERAPWPVEV